MRRRTKIIIGAVLAIAVGFVVLSMLAVIGLVVLISGDSGGTGDDCRSPGIPASLGAPPEATGSVAQQQISNAEIIAKAGADAGFGGDAIEVALVAATGESDLVNVDYGDWETSGVTNPDGSRTTSVGLFQQQEGWGSYEQRMDPAYAARSFLTGPNHDGSGGLVSIPGWQDMPITLAIHEVQINADPNHYTKFIPRAQAVAEKAGIDLTSTTDSGGSVEPGQASGSTTGGGCPGADNANLANLGSGPCPLDQLAADGNQNPSDCNGAINFMIQEMQSGSHEWSRYCLGLVAIAYGWNASGVGTAYQHARLVQEAGMMSTDTSDIPRGAVMWWDGRAVGNDAGHVAIYDGDGHILSNDVPVTDGRVGRVPWTYPEDTWGQKFMGWSPPYFPNAG